MDEAPLTAEELSSELTGLIQEDSKFKKPQILIAIGVAALIVILLIVIIIIVSTSSSNSSDSDGKPFFGEIRCLYDIKTTSQNTKILGDEFVKNDDFDIFIGGKSIKFAKEYKFDSTGIQDVQIKLYGGINMDYMFKGVEDLILIDMKSETKGPILSMVSTFEDCTNFNHFNLTGFDGSKIRSMKKLFYNSELMNYYFNSFNTENLEDVSYMFASTAINKFSLKGLNTSKITDMSYLFYNCPSADEYDFSDIDTSSLTNMSYMFANSGTFNEIDLSKFKTSQVISMAHLFQDCMSLTYVNFEGVDNICLNFVLI